MVKVVWGTLKPDDLLFKEPARVFSRLEERLIDIQTVLIANPRSPRHGRSAMTAHREG